jgi:hypothetical protein
MNCVAAKGFLTQSNCGAPAASACSHCGRMMCTTHLSPQSGFSMCLDCAATQLPEQPQSTQQNPDEYDGTWARGYRNSYYSSTGYRPYYGGAGFYDRRDSSSFDERRADTIDDDTERDGFDAS